jgi:hypothetical protein
MPGFSRLCAVKHTTRRELASEGWRGDAVIVLLIELGGGALPQGSALPFICSVTQRQDFPMS